jgi:hypothetical protein
VNEYLYPFDPQFTALIGLGTLGAIDVWNSKKRFVVDLLRSARVEWATIEFVRRGMGWPNLPTPSCASRFGLLHGLPFNFVLAKWSHLPPIIQILSNHGVRHPLYDIPCVLRYGYGYGYDSYLHPFQFDSINPDTMAWGRG